MTYQELLAELRNNYLRDSSALLAGALDKLWSDATLYAYIADAERRFARDTLMLFDRASTLAQITLAAGQTDYPLSASILGVRSARYDTDPRDLPMVSHDMLSSGSPVPSTYFDINALGTVTPGRPVAWSIDEGFLDFHVYPAPSAAEAGKVIQLRISRLPLVTASAANATKSPEFLPEYHLDLLHWAAYRALLGNDVDAGDPQAAMRALQRYDDAVAQARRDARRRTRSAKAFAFGENGYAWRR